MGRAEKRICLNCGEAFTADARNARHQRYCALAPCKAASKRESQAKWLAKPENQDYHRGPEAAARVQAWRCAHPGYSRRKAAATSSTTMQDVLPAMTQEVLQSMPTQDACAAAVATPTLQEALPSAVPEAVQPASAPDISRVPAQNSCNAPISPLQDFLNAQPIVLVGLIAHIWGSSLQEDIASGLNRLIQSGHSRRKP